MQSFTWLKFIERSFTNPGQYEFFSDAEKILYLCPNYDSSFDFYEKHDVNNSLSYFGSIKYKFDVIDMFPKSDKVQGL
jgi:hypothetical protein